MADSNSPRDDPPRGRRLRIEQARSVGVVLTLIALLVLVIYNTVAADTPWASRAKDVRLLMTLLSLLLGIDVILGNRRAVAELVGRALLTYADTKWPRNAGTNRQQDDPNHQSETDGGDDTNRRNDRR